MKHAILGAGAVGGLLGTILASLGENVTVVVRAEKLAAYPASLALERTASGNSVSAPAAAVSKLSEAVDVLWIATKTYQLQAALNAVQAVPRMVVPLLNGIDHVAVLRTQFGAERVVAATIAVEAERIAPGRFVQRSPFVRLSLAASVEPILGGVVERLRGAGLTCAFIANEHTLLWAKLCFLGPFALASSASGMNAGEIHASDTWKRKLFSAVSEAAAVANASGAQIDAQRIQSGFDGAPAGMRSSMQKDLAEGRRLELDDIAGPIVRGGEQHRIDVPVTKELMAAIRAKIA